MRQVQVLEYAGGNVGGGEGLVKALGAQRGLVRVLEYHGVAGDERGQHGVDGGQVGIIPRRHDGDDAERYAFDPAVEAGLVGGLDGGERCRCQAEHIACALFEAADFAGRVAQGAAHLPGDFGGDVVRLGDEGVDGFGEDI